MSDTHPSDRRFRAVGLLVLALIAGGWGWFNSGEVKCNNVPMPVDARCVPADSVNPGPDEGMSYSEKAEGQQRMAVIGFSIAGLFVALAAWQFIASFSSPGSAAKRVPADPQQRLSEHEGTHAIIVRLSGPSGHADSVEYGIADHAMVKQRWVELPWETSFSANADETVRIKGSHHRSKLTAKILVDGKRVERDNGKSFASCEHRVGSGPHVVRR